MPPKRRRRFQGLYYHSSPPKVLSMNGGVSNQNLRKRRDVDDFSVKLSTIRIWMHEKDIGKLTRILWAGQGNRLRQQASTNAKVKRFLAAVPYVMNSIKDVHQAVIDNNLETLQANLEPPVPPALITCKDANGLNVIHKAAGLGHAMILEFLIGVWPDGTHETDITGKTPLHWAASCKNNMRCYTLLTQAGCDEEAQDYKMKTPSYYRHKPHEIERAFLVFVPEAPRVSPDIATDWEALSDDTGDGKKLDIKIPDILTNGFHDRSNDNISEADVIEGEIEMHEDEKPDEDEADVVEAAVAAAETPETEPEEPQENDVDAIIEPEVVNENEKDATDENISNDMNDTPTTPTTPNMEKATENEDEDAADDVDVDNQEAQPETDVENNNNKEEEALEANKEDEEVVKNDESVETKEETAEETKENSDESEEEKSAKDTKEGEESVLEEESEPANLEQKTDEEKLDETVRLEEIENTEQDVDIVDDKEEDKEKETEEHNSENENEDQNTTEDKEEPLKNEDFDVDKDNNSHNAEKNEEEAIEEAKTEDVTTNETDETENGEESIELSKETEGDETEKETENKAEEEDNVAKSNEEDSVTPVDQAENEINNNEPESLDEVPTDNDSTNENDKEHALATPKSPNSTSGVEENINNETVVKNNAENEKRLHSATSLKSLGKLSLENGKMPTTPKTPKAINGNKKHSASSVRSKNAGDGDVDDDNDDSDGDDDDQDKVDNAAESEEMPIQENGNKELDEQQNEEQCEVDSPTSSLAIEGYVQGESEDNTVQSQSAAFVDEESRIQGIIASGDMEQLAQIVLNGDGNKLLNMQAPEPEIQAFLNNVPNYMNKIRRVHEAARNGNIMALQQALDRRKFAIAKDDISPNGSSPLHVAVLFGHSDIVRYLAARFPETTTITDDDGRTALHYAATIKDNGHFYNVLTQLGANPLAVDKLGHTPKFFLESDEAKDIVTYRQLLEIFGAAELEEELLNDQGQVESNSLETNPIFKTEQGKYLASTLAEPLTKALTEIANLRPEDPVAFLANFLKKYVRNAETNGHLNSGKTNSTALIESANSPEKKEAVPNDMGTGSGKIGHAQQNGNLQTANANEIEEEQSLSPDDSSQPKLEDRDEHGQSMLHFSSARSHRRGGLLHMIEESKIDITYRDELYRTARDVSLQANQPANAKEIDHYVLSLAVVGDLAPFEHLALSGYDHIIDVINDEGEGIIDVALAKGHDDLADFLKNIRLLEEQREELHETIRGNNVARVHELTSGPNGKWLISAKNYYGRTALHIAVLKESEEIVQHFVRICPEALRIGDNLERNALHYAMGTNAVETISRILIQKGAKRTHKDLKGRQPTYYFMNKADILRLQEEEDENR